MNHFYMAGRIQQVRVHGGKRSVAEGGKPPSAIILLQYGVAREGGNGPVEFLNAALIRIPAFRYDKIADKLVEGALVSVAGHIQGIMKQAMGEGYITSELVADNVRFEDMSFLLETEVDA
ncbi:hypothetical protein [Thiomonas sp.]